VNAAFSLEDDLFGSGQKASFNKIDVLPASVIDVGAQLQIRRDKGGHDNTSSRAEYSHFPQEVASICYELFLRDATSIFDPFAGWGERGAFAKTFNKNYVGFDINPVAIESALNLYGVQNTLADSADDDIPEFDGLITCPPYWNLESYSDSGIDAIQTWGKFLFEYRRIIERCYLSAKSGTNFCFMVGDWRDSGKYYDFTHQTRAALYSCGAVPVDELCVSRKLVSKIKVMIPQAVRLGYTVKVHETLLVFRKR